VSNLNNDGYIPEETYVSEPTYTAPVVEAVEPERSFLSRFWWLLPLLALLIALPFILRGCNRPVETPAAPPVTPVAPVAPVEPVAPPVEEDTTCTEADPCTIHVRWWGGDNRQALQLEAIRIFEEQHPGIRIQPEPTSLDGYFDALGIQAAAGNEPDVFTLGGAWPLTFAIQGVTQPIDLAGVDLSAIGSGALAEATYNGHPYAVPTGGNATALVVNPRIFEEAGVALPNDDTWTWEEFVDIANQISANTPAGTFGAEMNPQSILGSFVAQRDGIGMYTIDGDLNPNVGPALEAYFQMIQDLQTGGGMPDASAMSEIMQVGPEETLMGRGQGAMLFAPSNQLPAFTASSGDELILMRIPGETQFQTVGVALTPSQWWAIGHNTPYPHAAAAFINFMINSPDAASVNFTDADGNVLLMGVDRGNPLNEAQAAAIEHLLGPAQVRMVDYVARVSNYAGAAIPQPPGGEDQANISISSQESVAFGQMTPQQAAESWISRMETELANAR